MKKKNFFTATAISLLLAITVISCSKSSDNPATGPQPTVINIPGMSFSPGTVTVKVGTIVKWTNSDAMVHTATSDNGTTFDTGNISPGASATYTTTVTGSFTYHCTVHNTMTGTLIVVP